MVFQIPVDAHGNIDPGVASDDDRIVFAGRFRRSGVLAISCLVYLEEILVRFYKDGLELGSSSLVDSIQKIVCRISVYAQSNGA